MSRVSLSGSLTALTAQAALPIDFHPSQQLPSVRYLPHLEAYSGGETRVGFFFTVRGGMMVTQIQILL